MDRLVGMGKKNNVHTKIYYEVQHNRLKDKSIDA